jgi:hypothetical protein
VFNAKESSFNFCLKNIQMKISSPVTLTIYLRQEIYRFNCIRKSMFKNKHSEIQFYTLFSNTWFYCYLGRVSGWYSTIADNF